MLKVIGQLILYLFVFLFPNAVVHAQDSSTYFTVMNPEKFTIDWTGFYELNNRETARIQSEYPHHLNLAFGSEPKQVLDLYLPKSNVSTAPVFLFLHGGGFREGDKAHYGSVAEPYINAGIITAISSYRLTGSGAHYPAQSNDVKSAIKWLYENVEKYGGDKKVSTWEVIQQEEFCPPMWVSIGSG